MERYKGISSHPHPPPSPTERKMMSAQSIRREYLQEHLWEQGEGCRKEDRQMATEGTWSLSPTEEEIFSSSTEALIMERKQLRQQSSPLHVALVKCQKHFTEVHISMGEMELQTSGVWRSDSTAEAAGPTCRRRLSAGTSAEWREGVGWVCGWGQEPGKRQIEVLFLALPDFLSYTKQVTSLLGSASWSCPPAAALRTDTDRM